MEQQMWEARETDTSNRRSYKCYQGILINVSSFIPPANIDMTLNMDVLRYHRNRAGLEEIQIRVQILIMPLTSWLNFLSHNFLMETIIIICRVIVRVKVNVWKVPETLPSI
jgi:hypothetical protein